MVKKKTAKKATRKSKAKGSKSKADPKQNQVSSSALPRRTLEQSLRIAEVLNETYAGKSAELENICLALELGPASANTRYLFWAAESYGLITKEGQTISLGETGRKILSPTYEGEAEEGKIKAILTPTVLSQFFSDYNGHKLPGEAHFPNVLEQKFELPRTRVKEAIDIILANAEFAGVLDSPNGEDCQYIRLDDGGKSDLPIEEGSTADLSEDGSEDSGPSGESEEWSKVCFFITPIGEENSESRKHADMFLKHLVEPAAAECGLTVVRADKIDKSGLISQQIFRYLVHSRICVADLSFGNPNAFYELGVRHMSKRPTVQIIRKGDRIPFDVSQGRTIIVDTSDVYTVMDRFESARRELAEHLKHIVSQATAGPGEDNPVAIYLPKLKVSIPEDA